MLLVAAFLAFLGALPGPASAENLGFLLVLDSDANDQAYPALAHGEGNERYLAVWEDRTSGAIVGELMTADGTAVLDDFPIASKGGSDQGLYRPAVGYRPADDRFIVVWNRITSAGDSEIRGLVLDSDGTPVSPERLVAAVGSTTVPTGAVIAGDGRSAAAGGGFLLVFTDAGGNLLAQSIDSTGVARWSTITVAANLFGPPAVEPAVVRNFGTGRYLVAYQQNGVVSARELEPGYPYSYLSPPQTLGASSSASEPSAAWDAASGGYLVAWVDGRDSPGEIYGQRLSGGFALLGSNFLIDPADGLPSAHPFLSADPTGYVLVYQAQASAGSPPLQSSDILSRRVRTDGVVCGEEVVYGNPDNDELRPVTAYSPATGDFLAAWQHVYSSADSDIYGQVFIPRSVCNPPRIVSFAPMQALLGETYLYAVDATDADGDTLSYFLDQGPAGMIIDPVTGLLQWTPVSSADVGYHTVSVRVEDGTGGSDTQTWNLLVSPASLVFGFGQAADGLDLSITAAVTNYTAVTDQGNGLFDVSGTAVVTLGPRTFSFPFANLRVTVYRTVFQVVSGSVSILVTPTVAFETINPSFLRYDLHFVLLDAAGATGTLSLQMPEGTLIGYPVPGDPAPRPFAAINLKETRLTQDLDFVTRYSGSEIASWYFRADVLPLRFSPSVEVLFMPNRIEVGPSSLAYVEKDPAQYVNPAMTRYVSNDRYFSLSGWSADPPTILADGLAVSLSLDNWGMLESFEPLFPAGVSLMPVSGLVQVTGNRLDGKLYDIQFSVGYSGGCGGGAPPSTTTLSQYAAVAVVGPDGSLYMDDVVQSDTAISWGSYTVYRNATDPVRMFVPGFIAEASRRDTDGDGVSDLSDGCPATPSGSTVDAAGCAAADWSGRVRARVADHYIARRTGVDRFPAIPGSGIYAGLNFLAAESISAVMGNAVVNYSLREPAGKALFHVRRAGITGVTEAGAVNTDLLIYDYDFHLSNWGLAYLDSRPGDSVVDGDIFLPWPTDDTIEFNSLTLCRCGNLDQASVQQPSPPKHFGFWDTFFDPLGLVFKGDVSTDKCSGANTTQTLWVSMTHSIRHLDTDPGGVREEVSTRTPFDHTGEPGYDNNGLPAKIDVLSSRLPFDGFDFFPEEIRFGGWEINGKPSKDSGLSGYFELVGDTALPHFGLRKMGIRPYRGSCAYDRDYDPGDNKTCDPRPPAPVCPNGKDPGANRLCGDSDDLDPRSDDLLSKVDVKDPNGFFGVAPSSNAELLVEKDLKFITYKYGLEFRPPRKKGESGLFHAYEPLFEISGLFKLEGSALITPDKVKLNYGFLADAGYYWAFREAYDTLRGNLSDAKLKAFAKDYTKTVNTVGNWAVHAGVPIVSPAAAALADAVPSGKTLVDLTKKVRPDSWASSDVGGSRPFPSIPFKMARFAGSAAFINGGETWQEIYAETALQTSSFINFDAVFRMTRFVVKDAPGAPEHLEIEFGANNVPFDFAIEKAKAREVRLAVIWDQTNRRISGIEGSLILANVKFTKIKFSKLGAGVGVGANPDFYYFWGEANAAFSGNTLDGGVLVGKTRDLAPLKKVDKDVAAMIRRPRIDGIYARLDGSYSILNVGCLLRVNIGAGVGGWFFWDGPVLGGKIKGYVFGKVLCVVSARGDITLVGTASAAGYSVSDLLAADLAFSGTGFVAGGIGFCSPGSWSTPADVWADDWCYTCLAYLVLQYIDRWDVNYDAECE